MKTENRSLLLLFFVALLSCLVAELSAKAQTSCAIDWFTTDGGGGVSTGGVYSVSGTIGQPDASKASGGIYTLEGGFWGLIAAVQTTGSPVLSIRQSTGNAIVVAWPYESAGFGLQQNANLGTTNWTSSTNAPVHVGDEWQVTVTQPLGSRFYRLVKP